jgi:hypothetical protein
MKSVLIETGNDEELKMVKAFIKKNEMKGFIVDDSKANETDFLSDVAGLLIPII